MFFDTLGIKWWYEPEGFSLKFDYESFAALWEMDEEELLEAGVPQKFAHLDGKEYRYLPDFYLPELDYWLEIKGPNPTREEVEKAFMLSYMVYTTSWHTKSEALKEALLEAIEKADWQEAMAEVESSRVYTDSIRLGVYIIYGDIPWPFPQKGNIFGYGSHPDSGSTYFERLAKVESVAGESERKETAYRSLLGGRLKLCWQECPLCLKIGIGKIGAPYCRSCHDQLASHIWDHLPRYRVMSEAGTQDTSDQVTRDVDDVDVWAGRRPPNPANAKALELTKGLLNPEFFTSGHTSPKLQEAYSAARSARFEHGESP